MEKDSTPLTANSNDMERKIKTQQDNPNGLHQRYQIKKIKATPQSFMGLPIEDKVELIDVDPNSEYFVMRLDENGKDKIHVNACRQAVLHYAVLIKDHLPKLSKDLIKRYSIVTTNNQEENIVENRLNELVQAILCMGFRRGSEENDFDVIREKTKQHVNSNVLRIKQIYSHVHNGNIKFAEKISTLQKEIAHLKGENKRLQKIVETPDWNELEYIHSLESQSNKLKEALEEVYAKEFSGECGRIAYLAIKQHNEKGGVNNG
jgi:hypothetical protein